MNTFREIRIIAQISEKSNGNLDVFVALMVMRHKELGYTRKEIEQYVIEMNR